jgi:DNA invertase Pin-like site-specific DNA recombinase
MVSAIRAGVYYRMSSDRQEDSIPRQKSQVEPYCTRQGYTIVATHADEGIAGDEFDRRPGFQRLLKDAQAGKFDVIVADELSRLSRQQVIDFIAKVVHPLKEAGVAVDTVAEGPQGWDDVVQIITLAIRQDKSSAESAKMARRVMTSHLLLANKGGYTGGPPPYGYLLVPDDVLGKRLVPDPEKAEYVRLIFSMAAEGNSLGAIMRELRRRGVPTPSGRPHWSRNGLLRILHNRKYIGDYKWGEQATGKHVRQGSGQVRSRARGEARYATNGQDRWVIRPDSHEPLIDRETFERVQAQLRGNRHRTTPHVNGGGFVLNRLLVCEHCGGHMLGTTAPAGRRYTCGGYLNYGRDHCNKNTVPQQALVRLLVRKLQELFLDPDNLRALREEIRRQDEAERDPEAVARLRQQIDQLSLRIDQGNENLAILPADRVPGVVAKVRAWEAERDTLAAELERLTSASRADSLEAQIAAAEAMLGKLADALRDEDAPALRQVLHELVSKVVLRFTHRRAAKYVRSKLVGGDIYVRLQEAGDYLTTGSVSSSASTAQQVEVKLTNCDLPPGSPLSKNTCTGRLRVCTIQAPSSFCVARRYCTPF